MIRRLIDRVRDAFWAAQVYDQALEAWADELRHAHDRNARLERRVEELEALLDVRDSVTPKVCIGLRRGHVRACDGTPLPGTLLCLWCSSGRWSR